MRPANCRRSAMPSLVKIRSACFSTVRPEMPRITPISQFVLSCSIQRTTSASRRVRPSAWSSPSSGTPRSCSRIRPCVFPSVSAERRSVTVPPSGSARRRGRRVSGSSPPEAPCSRCTHPRNSTGNTAPSRGAQRKRASASRNAPGVTRATRQLYVVAQDCGKQHVTGGQPRVPGRKLRLPTSTDRMLLANSSGQDRSRHHGDDDHSNQRSGRHRAAK